MPWVLITMVIIYSRQTFIFSVLLSYFVGNQYVFRTKNGYYCKKKVIYTGSFLCMSWVLITISMALRNMCFFVYMPRYKAAPNTTHLILRHHPCHRQSLEKVLPAALYHLLFASQALPQRQTNRRAALNRARGDRAAAWFRSTLFFCSALR